VQEVAGRLRKFGVSSSMICTKSTLGHPKRISLEGQSTFFRRNENYWEVPYLSLPIGNSPIPELGSLIRDISGIDFDALYFANGYAFQDLIMYLLQKIHNKPIISGQHALFYQDVWFHDLYVKSIGRQLLPKFDACHVLTMRDLQNFQKWGATSTYLIPPGVDTKVFNFPNKPKRNEAFTVLFVGRLTLEKGFDIFCNTVRMINQSNQGKDFKFVVAGTGPLYGEAKSLTDKYSNVSLLGHIDHNEMPGIYNSADLFVISSRRESFGIAGIEAQACGLPIVATKITGPSEIVIDGCTGKLVRPQSAEALAAGIITLFQDWRRNDRAYEGMRSKIRKHIEQSYDWEVIIRAIYNMLQVVIPET
jgi:glycosyltransferase involved in cell wall biosynthesis